jgi:hypothetical protein
MPGMRLRPVKYKASICCMRFVGTGRRIQFTSDAGPIVEHYFERSYCDPVHIHQAIDQVFTHLFVSLWSGILVLAFEFGNLLTEHRGPQVPEWSPCTMSTTFTRISGVTPKFAIVRNSLGVQELWRISSVHLRQFYYQVSFYSGTSRVHVRASFLMPSVHPFVDVSTCMPISVRQIYI